MQGDPLPLSSQFVLGFKSRRAEEREEGTGFQLGLPTGRDGASSKDETLKRPQQIDQVTPLLKNFPWLPISLGVKAKG